MRTPLAKRQEILAAFDGSGVSAARFAAMAGINYSTFSSWVQERNQKQGKGSALTGAASKPEAPEGVSPDLFSFLVLSGHREGKVTRLARLARFS